MAPCLARVWCTGLIAGWPQPELALHMWGQEKPTGPYNARKRRAQLFLEKFAGRRRRLVNEKPAEPPDGNNASLSVRRAVALAKAASAAKGGPSHQPSDELWFESFRQVDAFEDFDVHTIEEWACCDLSSLPQHPSNGLPLLPALPLKVFSLQTPAEGSRRFVSTSILEMWRRTLQLAPASRHFYEILREDTPAHLYFDIEFSKVSNPRVDGQPLISTILQWVCTHMQDCFGAEGAFDASAVLDLDSSTARKFSRHIIIRLPSGCVFRSVAHVGLFVLSFVERLQRWRSFDEDVAALWVQRPPPDVPDESAASASAPASSSQADVEFIVDLAVYTKNRAMRQYLSTKPGRNAPLLPTRTDPSSLPPAKPPEQPSAGAAQLGPHSEWWQSADSISPTHPAWHAPPRATAAAGTTVAAVGNATARGVRLVSSADHVPVLVGSADWERSLWRFSMITDLRPPLYLAKGSYQAAGLLPDKLEHLNVPCCPVSGAKLLYMTVPAEPHCSCVPSPSESPLGADEAKAAQAACRASCDATAPMQPGCAHFSVCAEAWVPKHALRGGSNGVLGAYRAGGTAGKRPSQPGGALLGQSAAPTVMQHSVVANDSSQPAVPAPSTVQRSSGTSAATFPHAALVDAVCRMAEQQHPAPAGVRSWTMQTRQVVFRRIAGQQQAASAAAEDGNGENSTRGEFVVRQVASHATLCMQGNRFCHRIGRPHRSNNVNFVIDYGTQTVRQTCMDWECRQARFRSHVLPVPATAFPDQTPGRDFALEPHVDPATVLGT